ncbi:MAG TPA: hypothetical protein VFZ83_11740 [Acidimicrobiia bacterium]|nr:hypothetical protein [Acidimicrobiia bacterium]
MHSRDAMASTMVVLRAPGEVFLLCHTGGDDAISWVERIDPRTLEPLARSADLLGGPTWPGGIAAHANGSLIVVFGNHAHRLTADLAVVASRELPRRRPYNSFVVLADGTIVTKDFGGALPGRADAHVAEPTELVALEPERLEIIARVVLPEPSIARLSADGNDVYVVGTESLLRVRWDGTDFEPDTKFAPRYRTLDGQTYGWDAVLALGAAWFLDNGAGTDGYAGTFRGRGVSTAPLHLVRVDLDTGAVVLTEICGHPNGIVANPPVVDEDRRIVVGYDSANGVLAAFDIGPDGATSPRWRRDQWHACHPLLLSDAGVLLTNDHDADAMQDHVVLLDIETGEERSRVVSGSPVQSVLFPAPGWHGDLYLCSFTTLTRVTPTA